MVEKQEDTVAVPQLWERAAQRAEPSVGGEVLASRYQVLQALGQGGMAEVYLARDISLERTVALKLMKAEFLDHPELLERFRREGISAAGISHPNVVRIYDVGTAGDVGYLVMELVEGGSLEDRVSDGGGLSVEAWVRLATEMCSALAEVHSKGIIHRDVKPANILFDKEGQAKIADFGVAHLDDALGLTGTKVVGTVSYMAPEMLQGEASSFQSDLFALGRTLIFAATGNSKDPGLPPSFPGELQEWLEKTIAFKAQNRFKTMTEALEGLHRIEQAKAGSSLKVRGAIGALVLLTLGVVGSQVYLIRAERADAGAGGTEPVPSAPADPVAAAPGGDRGGAAGDASESAMRTGPAAATAPAAAPSPSAAPAAQPAPIPAPLPSAAPAAARPAPSPPPAPAGRSYLIQHSAVGRVLIGSKLKLRAVVDPTPSGVVAMLKIGAKGWKKHAMTQSGPASWSITIPVEGKWLSGASYYILVIDATGKGVARSGSRGAPHTLKVR